MKLILDVHHSRSAAERLRRGGHDVQAAADLLRWAAADGRVVVTQNAKDFDRIVRSWVATGEHHAGVVFTSPRRFHRGSTNYPENLIVALTRLLAAPPAAELDWMNWLD